MIRCGIIWMSGAAHGELRPTLTSVMANCARVLATHSRGLGNHQRREGPPFTPRSSAWSPRCSPEIGKTVSRGDRSRSSFTSGRAQPKMTCLRPWMRRAAASRSKPSHAGRGMRSLASGCSGPRVSIQRDDTRSISRRVEQHARSRILSLDGIGSVQLSEIRRAIPTRRGRAARRESTLESAAPELRRSRSTQCVGREGDRATAMR